MKCFVRYLRLKYAMKRGKCFPGCLKCEGIEIGLRMEYGQTIDVITGKSV